MDEFILPLVKLHLQQAHVLLKLPAATAGQRAAATASQSHGQSWKPYVSTVAADLASVKPATSCACSLAWFQRMQRLQAGTCSCCSPDDLALALPIAEAWEAQFRPTRRQLRPRFDYDAQQLQHTADKANSSSLLLFWTRHLLCHAEACSRTAARFEDLMEAWSQYPNDHN